MDGGKTCIKKRLMMTDLTEHLLSSPCPSPQLRMSFIVFSTEGRILMGLTEDRWVQILSEPIFNPLFSIIQLKGMSVIPDMNTGHTHL